MNNPTNPNKDELREQLLKILKKWALPINPTDAPSIREPAVAEAIRDHNVKLLYRACESIITMFDTALTKQLDEVVRRLPAEARETEWSDKHQRFILHRAEAVEGWNAYRDEVLAIVEGMRDGGNHGA